MCVFIMSLPKDVQQQKKDEGHKTQNLSEEAKKQPKSSMMGSGQAAQKKQPLQTNNR